MAAPSGSPTSRARNQAVPMVLASCTTRSLRASKRPWAALMVRPSVNASRANMLVVTVEMEVRSFSAAGLRVGVRRRSSRKPISPAAASRTNRTAHSRRRLVSMRNQNKLANTT
jgi:hypothetical protein